jgi:hypothetical protein
VEAEEQIMAPQTATKPEISGRNSSFSTVTLQDVRKFDNMLGADNVIKDDVLILDSFNTDFTKKYKGSAPVVLVP